MYRAHGLKPNFTEYCSDWLDQLSQVALGNGIAIMARTAISPDFLRFVPIDDEMCLRGIYLMWSATRLSLIHISRNLSARTRRRHVP